MITVPELYELIARVGLLDTAHMQWFQPGSPSLRRAVS